MDPFAPRIPPLLVARIEALADRDVPPAEIRRRVGADAARSGLSRPSYGSVRRIAAARRGQPRYPSGTDVLLNVAFRARPPEAILDYLAGTMAPLPPK